MNIQFEHFKQTGITSWKLLITPEKTWKEIADNPTSANNTFTSFVLPWIITCTMASIIGNIFWPEHINLAHLITEALFVAISLLGAYFASKEILKLSMRKFYNLPISKHQAATIIATTSSVIYGIKTLAYLFPALSILFLFSIYTTYLLWTACDFMIKIDENNRGKYLLTNTVAIVLLPWIIFKILTWLTPNIGF